MATKQAVKLDTKLAIRCERSLITRLRRQADRCRPKLTMSQMASQYIYEGLDRAEESDRAVQREVGQREVAAV